MKKVIILATDFSPAASNAAEYAADMALAIQADLLLLHVYQPPVSFSEVPVVVNLSNMQEDAARELKELKERLTGQKREKMNVETEVRLGTFFHELDSACQRVNPYAVVMGSQGTTPTERFFFGSHTVYAMKHLEWPLITVPKGATFSAIKRVGLACDFEKVAEIPVGEIKKLVGDFKAELHILNTGKKDEFDPGTVFESGVLQQLLKELNPQYHYITNEDIDVAIMEFAEKNQIDLLTVFPRRHSLGDKLMHKSHTKQFVLHSHVPVMALHPNDH